MNPVHHVYFFLSWPGLFYLVWNKNGETRQLKQFDSLQGRPVFPDEHAVQKVLKPSTHGRIIILLLILVTWIHHPIMHSWLISDTRSLRQSCYTLTVPILVSDYSSLYQNWVRYFARVPSWVPGYEYKYPSTGTSIQVWVWVPSLSMSTNQVWIQHGY